MDSGAWLEGHQAVPVLSSKRNRCEQRHLVKEMYRELEKSGQGVKGAIKLSANPKLT
ncbi:hypothetical protein SAMN05444162_2917 [Paenibacillaceae bacterium GAS479]|nr:hypothetical protein SAMN05444162_2917 [Paenibacillaceae bacterium GAS479]